MSAALLTLGASWGLTFVLHSTILLGAAWALTRMGWPRAAEAREALWVAAAVGGLLTASVALRHDARPPARAGAEVRVVTERRYSSGGELRVFRREASCRTEMGGVAVRLHCREAQGAAGGAEAALLLLIPCALGALRLHALRLRVMRARVLLDSLVPDRDPETLQASMRLWEGEGGRCAPRIGRSPLAHSPSVVLDTVVLPLAWGAPWHPGEAEAVIAHELAHLLRGDPLRLLAMELFATLGAFQPLLAVASREVAREVEFAADAVAVRLTGRPLALARALERAASRMAQGEYGDVLPLPALRQGPGRGEIEERVRRLVRPGGPTASPPRWQRWLAGASLVTPLLLAAPAVHLPVAEDPGQAHDTIEIRAFPDRTVVPRDAGGLLIYSPGPTAGKRSD